jgi:hypothetical protein
VIETSVTIEPGDIEPIKVFVVREDQKTPLTGLSNVKLKIQRHDDDEFFDWSDDTFKPLGSVGTLLQALEALPGNDGWYRLNKAGHVKGFDTGTITNANSIDTYTLTAVQDGSPQNAGNLPAAGELKVAPIRYVVLQGYSYDPAANRLSGNVWVEHDNDIVQGATSATVDWRDQTGALLFTMTDASPDANGFFEVNYSSPGLSQDKLYYATASVVVPKVGTIRGGKAAFTFGV